MTDHEQVWNKLLEAVVDWSNNHMDQWEMVKFNGKWGEIHLHISYAPANPEAYEPVTFPEHPINNLEV